MSTYQDGDKDRTERQKTSERFGQFVTVVFGLVISQGLTKYTSVVLDPSVSGFQFCALIGVFATTILSWIGYTRSMYKYPYDMTRLLSWLRMGVDFAAVSNYARLIFSLVNFAPGAASTDITIYVQGYFLVFVFYYLSGLIRVQEYNDKKASAQGKLIVFIIVYALLWGANFLFRPQAATAAGWILMLACPLCTIFYRILRQRDYPPVRA
jgi:hypothetical protein